MTTTDVLTPDEILQIGWDAYLVAGSELYLGVRECVETAISAPLDAYIRELAKLQDPA